jgi:soluble lytic murein transglycosylase-like protein
VPSAAAAVDPGTLRRLNGWIPTAGDLDAYLHAVRELLATVRDETLAKMVLDERFRPLFRDLVLATAWQESCWRQFVRKGGKMVPVRSPVGSIGIMQVNERVWRGVYDRRGLQGDIAYNARAGSEVLLHYLRDYAIAKHEDSLPGGLANLARATYAVYNGGPQQLTRYRARTTKRSLRAIDGSFWEKFVAVQHGRELDVAKCFGLGTS